MNEYTNTIAPTATDTPLPSETPTLTPTATPSVTPTVDVSSTPIGAFQNAYIDDVVHLTENSQQTMVQIIVDRPLEGDFRADIEIQWNSWDYYCFILGEENDQLFCIGSRLPATTNAIIKVFEVIGAGEESLVFESSFEVPVLIPTITPKPTKKSPATRTPSPTNTSIPGPTATPTQTTIPTSTNTPIPPTPTVPPWSTPFTPVPSATSPPWSTPATPTP